MSWLRKIALTPFLVAAPAWAAYDLDGVALGASESQVKQRFPGVYCKALEWASLAADRRCDESRVQFGGIEVRVTIYLKKDAVEAFDVRFDSRDAERLAGFLKSRYGKPRSEAREQFERRGKAREIYKVRWENKGERAVLSAQPDVRRAVLTVSRGDFEEEIYRVR